MSNISVDYDILNQKQTPAFYASSLATRPAFGFPGRIFIDTDTPSSGIYRDTGSAWVQVADPGAGTTGTLQQVTTNGNTTTNSIQVQGIDFSDGAGTGANNIAIGTNSLSVNTTGYINVALGYTALQNNTTGFANIGIGQQTLLNNTTGNANVGVGNAVLSGNVSGSGNTAVGNGALSTSGTASFNTAVGYQSLTANTTGANNVAIGYGALTLNTTASNNTAIGNTSLEQNTTGVNNTAIGSSSLKANTTGQNNTAIGTSSLIANTTGNNNTTLGSSSLNANTTGANNVAVGYVSLAANTTGGGNAALGFQSLTNNTTGANNTAVGSGAISLNTTGINNTAIGQSSLAANLTGSYNVALGVGTLGNNLGSYNVGIGHSSLNAITTGTNNSAIGYASGSAITTGSNNTIIGGYGGTTTLTSNIVLSDGAGNVRLFANDTGKVGINVPITDTPTGQVDIHTSLTNALVLNGNTTNNAYLALASAGVNKWRIGNTYNAGANSFDIYNIGTSSTALSINSTTNNIGIGTTNSFSDANYVSAYIGGTTGGQFILGNSTGGSANRYLQLQGDATGGYIQTTQSLPLLFFTNASERLRITSAGNFGFNTTTPNNISGYTRYTFNTESTQTSGSIIDLNVAGVRKGTFFATANDLYIGSDAAIPTIFLNSGSEKMRITTGGYTKISNDGTYLNATAGYHEMKQTASDSNVTILTNSSASPYGLSVTFTGASPNNATNNFLYCPDSTTLRAEIRSNGGIANYATNNVVLSDERLKKDITPLESVWNKVKNIEIVKYKYIDQTHDDFNMGVIAQQVEKFAPELVEIEGWGTLAEDGSTYKGIYETDINYYSIKAIQECMAKIEEQQKQIDAIKNN